MYSYVKHKKFTKRKMLLLCCILGVLGLSYFSYYNMNQKENKETAVFKEEENVVLTLADMTQKGVFPFSVKAQTVLEYYDGSNHDVDSITKFEGVYRGNQGIDYALNNESFEVMPIFSGTVTEVKEDELFGQSVTIQSSDAIKITYQSLSNVSVKQGDEVSQKQVFANAGENIYHKDLGVHLHVVVEQNGVVIDPKLVYDKTLEELK